ncbi:hypothetical protein A249_42006, partial [Pseudomonas syringae pv. actinidiae ICMP 18804]
MAHILMMAKADVESEIWRQACSQYAGQLASMLDDALCFFGRKPGLDDRIRPAKSPTQPRKAQTWCALK